MWLIDKFWIKHGAPSKRGNDNSLEEEHDGEKEGEDEAEDRGHCIDLPRGKAPQVGDVQQGNFH